MAAASAIPAPTGEAPPNAFRALINRLQESGRAALAQQRPWSEVTDRANFSRPENLNDALGRVRKNLNYFYANYLTIILAVVVLSMLWNPMAILWLALLAAAWIYIFMIRTEPVIISGRTLNEREKFLGLAIISIIIIFGLTTVGSVLISGVIIGAAAITVHAAFRIPDDLFLDDGEAGTGFLSFLGTSSNKLPTSIGV